jgi:hypothetical protein
MPPNTDHAHNKHIRTIACNFSQVQMTLFNTQNVMEMRLAKLY